jgi:macrolide-specific efflux system membrane fusion protein
VVNNVVLYDALFDVANPDRVLMTQMTAQVFFVVSSAKDAMLVPLTALRPAAQTLQVAADTRGAKRASGADARNQFTDGRALVSVIDAAGKIVEREVKVGVMNRVTAQILSGLELGEKVVIGTRPVAVAAPAQSSSSLVPAASQGRGHP